ncbi:hypothetical protein T265_03177 [Opisthorchis viverrini]|uniref:Uncharacterized protein n=1 Tax=Opisthorchis viverrini TaxID=6198 RepID=A0A074ZTK0_OPIVI|nr:hypothetical protein T265_03177 [Opisthorchis viverrini]KER30446.1 hypothetical protein T265_03177 [Opisthorchis viverrini]
MANVCSLYSEVINYVQLSKSEKIICCVPECAADIMKNWIASSYELLRYVVEDGGPQTTGLITSDATLPTVPLKDLRSGSPVADTSTNKLTNSPAVLTATSEPLKTHSYGFQFSMNL